MSKDTKIIELAKKLKALADRGVEGEKVNAQKMLEKIVREHNLNWEDIETDVLSIFWIRVEKPMMSLFNQVIYSVCGKEMPVIYTNKTKGGFRGIETTTANFIEIEAKFDFYQQALKRELDKFESAFFLANKILPSRDNEIKRDPLSPEEMDKLMEIINLSKGIKADSFNKQLNRG